MSQSLIIDRKPYSFSLFLLLIFWLLPEIFTAQTRSTVEVLNLDNSALSYPWAGGMNSVQFGEIDLNRDGLKDLLAFDRNGNRKMCFINYGVLNAIDYSYQPQFEKLLPEIFGWVVFRDYDGDGRTDIFTYSPGWAGMKVYRNISQEILKFKLVVYPYLKTFQENGYVNLLVTDVDYPAIFDIDSDGDLDILAFWGLGSFVNYHRNMSMEKYGNADSLDFRLEEYCWGFFAESEESNTLYFDTCFIQKSPLTSPDDKERHRGSTFLVLDLNNDSLPDVLLGDVDYPKLFALENSGTKFNAYIASADTSFPQTSEQIKLFNFPVTAYIDVNNDGKKDLLVSPFDPRLETSQNKKSVWLYLNTGGNSKPFFTLKTKDFLQSQMIDRGAGAYPVLFDWDGDGLLDLFVGNYGFYKSSFYHEFNLESIYQSRIGYFKNIGDEHSPAFQLWDDDFGNLGQLEKTALIPSFADLDGDGNVDFLVGDSTGNLIFVKNLGGDEFEIVSEKYQNINKGFFSTPQLFDLDKDGLDDLIIGEQKGNLNYYRNEGSATNPNFVFVTDSLGKIYVRDISTSYNGFSVPGFFRLPLGETQLVVGSEQGKVYYYTNIDGNLDGAFTESDKLDELLDTTGVSFDRGIRVGAAIADINNDEKVEMVVGNYSGGLEYFNGNAEVMPGILSYSNIKNKIRVFPNPAKDQVEIAINSSQTAIDISITDINGRTVFNEKLNQSLSKNYLINTSSLKNGFYIILLRTEAQSFIGKIVIQR